MRSRCESASLPVTLHSHLRLATRIFSAAACAVVACFAVPASPAYATVAAHFAGVQTRVSACTSECFGVAVDTSGNVYIADTYNNRVLKESPSANGYTQSVVATGFNLPYGVAVDGNGNVYVADSFNKQIVKETLSAGSYTPSVILSGLPATPFNVAVDALGNVYLAGDTPGTPSSAYVYKLTPSGSSYSQSLVAGPSSGMQTPWEVAVDSNGNVFVTDAQGNAVYKETPSGNSYSQSTVATGLDFPTGVAVDSIGNVYISNAYKNQILMESPAPGAGYTQSIYAAGTLQFPYELAVDTQGSLYIANPQLFNVLKETPGAGNFGSVNVGAQSQPLNMVFVFDSPGSIGNPSVVTQGAANLDFGDSGGGSCTTNGTSLTYSAGQTCILQAMFVPTHAGVRSGAGSLTDTSGQVIASGYLQGMGVAPEVVFSPPAQKSLGGIFSLIGGLAVDGNDNVYVSDVVDGVFEIPYGCFSSGCMIALGGGYTGPSGLAIDGSGNLFFGAAGNVVKEVLPGCLSSACTKTIDGGFQYLDGVAVDFSGNLYVADYSASTVKEMPLGCASSSCVKDLGGGLDEPKGLAVDATGNVYVTVVGYTGGLKKIPFGCTSSVCVITLGGGSFNGPTDVAVGGNGNLYVADTGALYELPSDCVSPSCVTTLASGFYLLGEVALDGSGNLYIDDTAISAGVLELERTTPTMAFAPTPPGSTSTDSPKTATVQNIGNAPLSFPLPSSGYNPSVSPNFQWDSSSTCIQNSASSSAVFSLAAGASCDIAIDFEPTTGGNISGSVILTDNALNATAPNYAMQTIGLAIWAPTTTAVTSAAATFSPYQQNVTLKATVTSNVGPVDEGEVTFTVLRGGNQYGTATTAAVSNGIASASYTLNAGLLPGTYTIKADYTDTANFLGSSDSSHLLTIGTATPDIAWAAPADVAYGTALSSTQLDATASVAGTFAYSPAAGAILPAGSQTLSVTFTPTDTTDYATAADSVTLTVNQATPAIALSSSLNPSTVAQSVTFTATVSSPSGTPTGTVAFYDGTTQLGPGTLASGVATYTTTALAAGSHSITAQYSGDANFAKVTSAALTQTVTTFSIGPATGAPTTATGTPGGIATYLLSITPPASSSVTLSVSGLPSGFDASFSPSSVAAGTGSTQVEMTVNIPATVTSTAPPARPGLSSRPPVAFGLLLLPMLGLGRSRRARKYLLLVVLGVGGLLATAGISGCSHNFNSFSGSNGNPPPPGTYSLTVTATAGTQTQSTTLTLTIE